mmetsp:Transcript_91707/g.137322  ORF Transcript_91707/g.137322 Transcript_91707/m.137322 type:complete len:148 (+) Transcript_91707:85-528(+)
MNYATQSPTTQNVDPVKGARSFPRKLFTMLEEADSQGFSDIVSWQPDGSSFRVHKPKKFATTIMCQYFNQTRYKSFQRQLNIYGFQRIHTGPKRGGYEHPCMNRSSPELCQVITRLSSPEKLYKSTVVRPHSKVLKILSRPGSLFWR